MIQSPSVLLCNSFTVHKELCNLWIKLNWISRQFLDRFAVLDSFLESKQDRYFMRADPTLPQPAIRRWSHLSIVTGTYQRMRGRVP